jgi:hypothetical protein
MGIFSLRFRVLIVLAVGLSLVTSFAVAQTSSALSEKSPNPADMVSIGAPYPAPWGGAAEHLLKNENTSQIMAINMAAYYTNANERNVIDIYWSQTPAGQRRCTISPGGGVRTEGYALITITAANKKNPSSTIRSVYRIPYANMCDNTSTRTNVGNNSDGKSGNWQRNIFSARYPVPGNFNAGTVNIDPLTGRYKVYVTVALTPNVIRTNGTSDRQEVGFRVRTSGTGAKLGILRDSAEAARNFSTVGVRGRDYGIQERFAFGLPCNEEDLPDPADPTNAKGIVRRVAIYDADVTGRFGALDFWVEEKAPSGARERLPADRFERGSNLYIKSTSGGVVFSSTAGTGQNSSVYIKNMRPGYEYSLVIEGEKERQSNNLIGIGLPGDAIYGEVTCASDYNLTPDITFVDGSMSPGENLPIVSKVTPANSGVGTDPTRWVVTKFVYNNNQPIDALRAFNSVRDTQQDPCGAYPAANRDSCSSTWSTSPNSDKANEEFSSSKEETFTYRATSGEIGKRVCFVTSISYPRDSAHRLANQTWRHSRLQCALIAKRPKVQVLGTDLRVAGDIKTSVSPDIDGKTFGSWVEYGVFSTAGP